MTVPLVAQVGLTAAILLLGVGVERRLAGGEPLVPVSRVTRILVVGLSLTGPFVLLNRGVIGGVFGLNGIVVALGCSLALYAATGRVVGVRPEGDCAVDRTVRPED